MSKAMVVSRKTSRIIFLSILLFLPFSHHIYAQEIGLEKIVITTDYYPPYYNKSGAGLGGDIYRAAFAEVGIVVEFKAFPINRALKVFLDGTVDAHSPGDLFIHGDDREKINWTTSFKVVAGWVFYVPNQKRIELNTLADLKGYRLGTTIHSPNIETYRQYELDIHNVQTPLKLVKMTKAGRFDFFETSHLTNLLLVKSLFPNEWHNFDFVPSMLLGASLAFVKDNVKSQQFKQLYDKGFDIIKQNGKYLQIHEAYWGENNVPKDVLPDELKQFGVEQVDVKLFHSFNRDENGKILR